MTDDSGLNPDMPLQAGTVLLNPIDDRRWEVTDVERTYAVRISPEDPDAGEEADEIARYPEPTLKRKLDLGDLVGHPDEPQPADEDQPPYTCPVCGDQFGSQQAVSGHQSAHTDGS